MEEDELVDPTVLPFLEARMAYEHGDTAAIFTEIDMVLAELADRAQPSPNTPPTQPTPSRPSAPVFDALLPWGGLLPSIPEMAQIRMAPPLPPPPRKIIQPPPRRPVVPVMTDVPMQNLVFSDSVAADVHPLDAIFQQPAPEVKKKKRRTKQIRPRRGKDAHLTWHLQSHLF